MERDRLENCLRGNRRGVADFYGSDFQLKKGGGNYGNDVVGTGHYRFDLRGRLVADDHLNAAGERVMRA